MAPVVQITDFVAEQLAGATRIVVRQVLICPARQKHRNTVSDLLSILCGMARKRVEIEVYLDAGA
jgi:hypothetical protein